MSATDENCASESGGEKISDFFEKSVDKSENT